VHTNLVSITAAFSAVASLHATGNQLHDLLEAIGPLSTTGNVYSANGANLNLNRSAGSIFKFASNPDYDNPHTLAIAGMTAGTLIYNTSTGTIISSGTTVNVTQYESAPGVLTTLTNNRWVIQRIFFTQSGLTRIQLGTAQYQTLLDAEAAVANEPFTIEANLAREGILRCHMIVQKNATALNDASKAKFLEVSKFGGQSSGSVALTAANIIAALGYTPETDTALPAHVAAADPHPQYLVMSEPPAAHPDFGPTSRIGASVDVTPTAGEGALNSLLGLSVYTQAAVGTTFSNSVLFYASGGTGAPLDVGFGAEMVNVAGAYNFFAATSAPNYFEGVTTYNSKVILRASTAANLGGLRLPHGVTPTTPTNGDVWTTTSGIFVRINGSTVGPLGATGSPGVSGATLGTVLALSLLSVTF
jgi:hypothetical protein